MEEKEIKRCKWVNLSNPLYVKYHDEEWGKLNLDDQYLFKCLFLETFQAGLSWECILNKRENFKEAFDNFNYKKIAKYDENKIEELLKNEGIIRNKLKIKAAIKNAQIFISIQEEFNDFKSYLLKFSKNKIYYEVNKVTNKLSDEISSDLYQRGMRFIGSTTIYAFLQSIGIINSHEKECFCYKR